MTEITFYTQHLAKALTERSEFKSSLANAFVKSLDKANQLRNLDDMQFSLLLDSVLEGYYIKSEISIHAMKAIVDMLKSSFGSLSMDEVNEAFRMAASGEMPIDNFTFVPTAPNVGMILRTYVDGKRKALVKAQIELENRYSAKVDEKRREEQLTIGRMVTLKKIKEYATKYIRQQSGERGAENMTLTTSMLWYGTVCELVDTYDLQDLTEDERNLERQRSGYMGNTAARMDRTGIISVQDILKRNEEYTKMFYKGYLAAALIEKNADFFSALDVERHAMQKE